MSEEDRVSILEHTHPLYDAEKYRLLLDAYEGTGGFRNGEYLWQYANEKDGEFKKRQAQARYHNYIRALVNIYVRHVFREGVNRAAKGLDDLEAWWKDVDGAGTSIDTHMKRGAKLALAGGISGALIDKEPVASTGPSRADDRGRVIASWFAAANILDWDQNAGELLGIKLLEAQKRTSILSPVATGGDGAQYLIWTRDGWARFGATGDLVGASDASAGTPLGLVPVAIVRPDPSAEHPFLGHALAGDGGVFRSLYNRCSEEDEVLRDQAFSQLTVNVPPDGDVEAVKRQIGSDMGTTTAIVAHGEVDYITADMQAPEQIRKNVEFLIKEIYRMAHVRFERDTLDAESGDALRLQYTELNEMIANLAKELQDAEWQIVKFWFLWTHPGQRDVAEQAFEAAKAKITIQYPKEFFVSDLLAEIEKWAKAIAMELGIEFEHYAKKRVVDQLAPDLPVELKQKIHAEIDTQLSRREQSLADAQARLAGSAERMLGDGKAKTGDEPPPLKPDDKQPIEAQA